MNKFYFLCAALLFAACKKQDNSRPAAGGPSSQTCPLDSVEHDPLKGRYIVALKTSLSEPLIDETALPAIIDRVFSRNKMPARSLRTYFSGQSGGFITRLTTSELLQLKGDPAILRIEPDRVIAMGDCFEVVDTTLLTWNIKKVGYGDGRGKTAWIIDSGIDFDHPDLDVDSASSRSFLDDDPSAADAFGHGTHVAGIIGAKNNDFGVLGVASGATLVSLRVLDPTGSGTIGGMVQALAYAGSHASPGDVINISVDADTISDILDQQVKETAAKGIFVVIAAGNDAMPFADLSPARCTGENIYTVTAIDSLDYFASFSNYGKGYAAPGVQILSTWLGGTYAIGSGTSDAAPHLAGLLLLDGPDFKTSGTALNAPGADPNPIVHQ